MKKTVAIAIYVVLVFVSAVMFAVTDCLWGNIKADWFMWGALGWIVFFSLIVSFLSIIQLFFTKTHLREKLGLFLRSPFTFVALMLFVVLSGAVGGGLWKIERHGLFINKPPVVEEPYAKPDPVGLDGTSTIYVDWKDIEGDAVMFELDAETGEVSQGPLVTGEQKYIPKEVGLDTVTVEVYDTRNPRVIKTLTISVTAEKTEKVQETWRRAIDSLGGGAEPADFESAKEYLDALTALAPSFDQAWMAKGLAYSGSQEWPLAMKAFDEYIEIRERSGIQAGSLPYLWKAYVEVNEEELPQALTNFQLAAQRDPELNDLLPLFEKAKTKEERLRLIGAGIIQSPNPFLSILSEHTFPSSLLKALD